MFIYNFYRKNLMSSLTARAVSASYGSKPVLHDTALEVTGTVIIEVAHLEDAVGIPDLPNLTLHVHPRSDRGIGHAVEQIILDWELANRRTADVLAVDEADTELAWEESLDVRAKRYGWVAGEAGWAMGLRKKLLAHGALEKEASSFMGYWKKQRA